MGELGDVFHRLEGQLTGHVGARFSPLLLNRVLPVPGVLIGTQPFARIEGARNRLRGSFHRLERGQRLLGLVLGEALGSTAQQLEEVLVVVRD